MPYIWTPNNTYSTPPTPTFSRVVWTTDAGTTSITTPYYQTTSQTATSSSIWWAGNEDVTGVTAWWVPSPGRIYRAPPERIHRPAIIRRRSVTEHAREVVRDVTQRRETGDVNRRALRLLMSHLTPVQRQTFIENGWFVVEGGRSKQRYRIRGKNVMANIDVLDGERVAHRLCGHCDHSIPISDQLLAQKIMLEVAEDDFLKLANRHAA